MTTRAVSSRSPLLAPLLYLLALLLLLEEWLWHVGGRIAAWIARWPPLGWLEARVRALPPYLALGVFVLPGLLLFPVKVLALIAIAHGHAAAGIATIALAKLGGAAVVARLYTLTLPALLSLSWFARLHHWFIGTRDRLVGRLRASNAYRRTRRLVSLLRRKIGRVLRRLRPSIPFGSRHGSRWARTLRRLVVLWRARRRQSNHTERP